MRKLALAVVLAVVGACAQAQTGWNCGGAGTAWTSTGGGVCSVFEGSGQAFELRGQSGGGITSGAVNVVPTGNVHGGYGFFNNTAQNIQAFTAHFTFIPNDWNIAFVVQNVTVNPGYTGGAFTSGAGCEGGFYQGFGTRPNNIFAMSFSNSDTAGTSGNHFGSVQIYQQNEEPCQPNDGSLNWVKVIRIDPSPVHLTPAGTQYTYSTDIFDATVTYDGSTVTLNLFDFTAGGSCPSSSCFTQTWSNVSIPSLIDSTTGYVGFSAGVGSGSPQVPSTSDLLVTSFSYSAATATASPGSVATSAGLATAANPIFSPAAGSYTGAQSVTITSPTTGSYVCYAVGTAGAVILPIPDNFGGCGVGSLYTAAVTISSSETLYATAGVDSHGANGSGYMPSGFVSGAYTIGTGGTPAAAVPVFSPTGGAYTGAQSVTIADTTSAATIYYTTNGSTPTTSSAVYTGAIAVGATETLKAIATASGYTQSASAAATYTITTPAATPTLSLATGTYVMPQSVSLTDFGGTSLFYCTTTAGSCTPATAYTAPVAIAATSTLCANGTAAGYAPSATVCHTYTQANTCPIAVGGSISSVVTACPSGSVVTFAAGTYTLASQVSVPCGVSLAGPQVAPYALPTATINWTGGQGPAFNFGACTTGRSIASIEINMNHPSPDGGQALYFAPGQSNLTLGPGNFFHGNQASVNSPSFVDGLVYFDGGSTGAVNSNVSVLGNRFGAPGDCSNVMSLLGGTGAGEYPGFGGDGGYCVGLGMHNGFSSLKVWNNDFNRLEQGMKTFEGSWECVLCDIGYNDFAGIHRIGYETQANGGASYPVTMSIHHNSMHDQYAPGHGTFGISAANGCASKGATGCVTNTDNNVVINNVSFATTGTDHNGLAIEVWGVNGTTASNNYIAGYWANDIEYSPSGQFVFNNNVMYSDHGNATSETIAGGGGPFFGAQDGPTVTPTASGNTFPGSPITQPGGTLTSVAPTIAPAPETFTGSVTVTFTNPVTTGRDANTGIWYTTDGTAPVPGAGTATYIASGGSIILFATTTVRWVGMWGAQNQPTSYPAGYGYLPSAAQSATYTLSGGSTPTVATPVLAPGALSFTGSVSVTATDATSGAAIYCTTDGTTPTTASALYGTPFAVTATETIACLAAKSGYINSAVNAATYTLNVTAPALTGGYLSYGSSVNSFTVGSPAVQFGAFGTYSDGLGRELPDRYGNTATWSSSNASVLSVSSTGLVQCIAPGSADVVVVSSPGLVNFSHWTAYCAGVATLVSGTLSNIASATSLAVGAPAIQFLATGTYSDKSKQALPDANGNVATWSSSNAAILTVGSTGLVSCAAIGSANVQVTATGGIVFSPYTLYCTTPVSNLVSSAYQSDLLNIHVAYLGQTIQQHAFCVYPDGTSLDCTSTDARGNAVTAWTATNSPAVLTIGAVGTGAPGLVTANGYGTSVVGCTVTGGVVCQPWSFTIRWNPAAAMGLSNVNLSNVGVQ